MTTDKLESDRRGKSRFKIRRELRYKLLQDGKVVEAGPGVTDDIGSGGVAFRSDRPFRVGEVVELSISWPVLLEKRCPMQLSVLGKVLRSEGQRSVCSVDRYEFRTQARQAGNVQPIRNTAVLQRWAESSRRETMKAASF
jgi:PilZ domain